MNFYVCGNWRPRGPSCTVGRVDFATTATDSRVERSLTTAVGLARPVLASIAIIERLWRTLKDALRLRSFKPLTKRDLERRLHQGLYCYSYRRPHQGLGGATPAEIYFGREPAHLAAVHPPRARPREGPVHSPFEIAYLDPDQMLPVLIRKAA